MNLYTAKCLLVEDRRDWSRPKLPYLPLWAYFRVDQSKNAFRR
ncbi:MAG: hypothetical protein AAF198_12355 [Pseudomonadota bacterium]